ncbi:MAG: hypothetical protein ACXVX9_14590, partial [Mycobacteriaceae bacterium]
FHFAGRHGLVGVAARTAQAMVQLLSGAEVVIDSASVPRRGEKNGLQTECGKRFRNPLSAA